jgi:hypothetical protein
VSTPAPLLTTSLTIVDPDAAPADLSEGAQADRRSDERRTVSDLPGLNEVRLKYGPAVEVLDLSTRGALIEVPGFRLQPGSTVVIEIAVDGSETVVPAQVLRCHVSRFAPHPVYRGGVAFKRPIALPESPLKCDPDRQDAVLAREFERMTQALERSAGDAVSADALMTALTLLEAPAAKRGGPAFAFEAARLFRTITAALDRRTPGGALVQALVEHLRRVVPTGAVRLVEGSRLDRMVAQAPLCFDVSGGDVTTARLLIDFPKPARIENWHFQYLKLAAHLITVLRHAGPAKTTTPTAPPDEVRAIDEELPLGWHKLVVRYIDGRMLKGYSQEFTASSASLHVWPSLTARPSDRITVPLAHLKAVFFVRDFEGSPVPVPRQAEAGRRHGRRVAVTFLDGEVIEGTTLNYSPDAIGFFIRPVDDSSNNVRVFVAAGAIRQVRFP